jgi:hypothetical protein
MTEFETVQNIEPQDPRLGRNIVHDRRSKNFPMRVEVDKSTWRDKEVRLYDPWPNPNQPVGNCTGCAKAMEFNAVGNREMGVVFKMDDATHIYSRATELDPWDGSYPPDDTGSSGLAAAKASREFGYGGEYRWLFGGADEIVQTIMSGRVVNVGTWWHWDMFNQDADGLVRVGGGKAGGHQWIARGYDESRDWVEGRCWWGEYRDFWITRADLDALMRDYGDAHVQDRA